MNTEVARWKKVKMLPCGMLHTAAILQARKGRRAADQKKCQQTVRHGRSQDPVQHFEWWFSLSQLMHIIW